MNDMIKLNLEYLWFDKSDIFSEMKSRTLKEMISKPRYSRLKAIVFDSYKAYFNLPIGSFLFELKKSGDGFYKKFLNMYGDETYCYFRLKDQEINKRKGIYFYMVSNEIVYIGRCRDSFINRFNNGYGRISARNCYLDGQSTNCHINSKVNQMHDQLEVSVISLEDNKLIEVYERELIKKFSPKWNKALRR